MYAKCSFGANFVPTCEYKTSRDLATNGPIFANLDLKKKSNEKVCRGFCMGGGGGQINPPVKIGLKEYVLACMIIMITCDHCIISFAAAVHLRFLIW